MTGAERIADERARQMTASSAGGEGYDAEHDRGHADELARAAACYAIPVERRTVTTRLTAVFGLDLEGSVRIDVRRGIWPWAERWWKPGLFSLSSGEERVFTLEGEDPTPEQHRALRIRELEKAGALIAAAIDSLLAEEA